MARQIQQRVRELTDKPLLYLFSTNYHGDHTFGNYAFPRPASRVNPLLQNFHRLNVLSTYRALIKERGISSELNEAA